MERNTSDSLVISYFNGSEVYFTVGSNIVNSQIGIETTNPTCPIQP